MESKIKKILFITLAGILAGAEIWIFSMLPSTRPDLQWSGNISYADEPLLTGPLGQSHTLSQTFTAQHNRLQQIDIFFATYERNNPAYLAFRLIQNGQVVASGRVDQRKLVNNAFYAWKFSPQTQSAHQEYTLTIHSADGTDEGSVTARYHQPKIPGTSLSLDGQELAGSLFMVPYYGTNWENRLWSLIGRINVNKGYVVPSWFLAGLGFVVVWGLNIALSWLFAGKSIYPKSGK